MSFKADKLTFFRQSGWMVMATVASGMFMSAVHVVVNKPMLPAEYALFYALLRVFLFLGFPAGGLQVVFAQQAAAAVDEAAEKKLAQTTRSILRATFLIWLGMAALVFVWRHQILTMLKISNPAALWVTVLLGLAALWLPVLRGLLQGRQNFAGLGWVLILDGAGRFTAIVLIVQLGGQAAGGMTGALIGQVVALGVGAVIVWKILSGPGAAFEWRPWLRNVVPLTFGVGVVLFMCNADVIYVQTVFEKYESPFYAPANMIGLALVTFTTPMAAVMFPKIVQSAARTEKSHALRQALTATALLGGIAALACTFFPQLPLRIIYFRNPIYWSAAPLVPWFAWALLPLILANVLVNNLLARQRFQVVPWLVLVAMIYGAALFALKDRILQFSGSDIANAPALVRVLESGSDPVAAFVWDQFSAEKRALLTQADLPAPQLRERLAAELNRVAQGPLIHEPGRSGELTLSEDIQELLTRNPQGKDLLRLNRLLLQEAFPEMMASRNETLFRQFKKIVATLGVSSCLLLLVALWWTFKPAQHRHEW